VCVRERESDRDMKGRKCVCVCVSVRKVGCESYIERERERMCVNVYLLSTSKHMNK
jgi:hypothetical protein